MASLAKAVFSDSVPTKLEDEFASTYRALNPEFVERFKKLNINKSALREFVYAVDHLVEMMELKDCPVNATLVSQDVQSFKVEAFMLFNELFRMTNNPTWKMKVVSTPVQLALKEFFDRGYLSTIHFIATQMGMEGLNFTVERREHSLYINEIVPESKLHVLCFADKQSKTQINIPFARRRARSHTKSEVTQMDNNSIIDKDVDAIYKQQQKRRLRFCRLVVVISAVAFVVGIALGWNL